MTVQRPHVPARFADRRQAGAVLAEHLDLYAGRTDLVVLALPRGGVPIGYEVARHLHAPLDVLVVRKLGAPGHPEFAIGAIAGGGISVLDESFIAAHRVPARVLDAIVQRERAEVVRRERAYRANRPPVTVKGQVVIVVASGSANARNGTSRRPISSSNSGSRSGPRRCWRPMRACARTRNASSWRWRSVALPHGSGTSRRDT